MKGAKDTIRTNVCNRCNLNVVWRTTTNQNVSFVTRTDDPNANGVFYFFIAKIHGSKSTAGDRTSGHNALHKLASCETDRFIEIIFTDCALVWGQWVHG